MILIPCGYWQGIFSFFPLGSLALRNQVVCAYMIRAVFISELNPILVVSRARDLSSLRKSNSTGRRSTRVYKLS